MKLQEVLETKKPFRRPFMGWYFSPNYMSAGGGNYTFTKEDKNAKDWEVEGARNMKKKKSKKYKIISIRLPKDVSERLKKAAKFANISAGKAVLFICGLEIFKGR